MEDYSRIDNIEQLKDLIDVLEEEISTCYAILEDSKEDKESIMLEIKNLREQIKDIKLKISKLEKKKENEFKSSNRNIFLEQEEIERLERKIMIKRQELENETDEHKKFLIGVDIRILERRIEFYKEPKWSLF